MMMTNDDDIEQPILSDHVQQNLSDNSISSTQWKIKHQCCCCGPCVQLTVPGKRSRYFLRHWEFAPFMPIFVSALIIFCTLTYFVILLPNEYLPAQIFLTIIIIFFLILFCWSYFSAVCMDPGFLPFNWIQTKKFSYSWQDQLSGLAVTSEQFEFARHPSHRPPKSSFSHSSGRFVIRGDHICGWIANWVGIRNHKQFILMNLYDGLFCLSLLIAPLSLHRNLFSFSFNYTVFIVLSIAFEGAFCLTLLSMFITTLVDIYNHRTKLQRMRNQSNDDPNNLEVKRTFKESMEEVCGTKTCCCNWLIPLPAFDDTLVIDFNEQPLSEDQFRQP